MTFRAAVMRLQAIASFGAPSSRMMKRAMASQIMNIHEGTFHSIYSFTNGSRCSDDPNSRADDSGNAVIATTGTSVTTVAKIMACVTLSRAALVLPCDRCMDATTEHPAPIINPIPVTVIKTGIMMLIAAMPSLPTLCPTKMPSIAVTADMPSIPSKVGMKYLPNNL